MKHALTLGVLALMLTGIPAEAGGFRAAAGPRGGAVVRSRAAGRGLVAARGPEGRRAFRAAGPKGSAWGFAGPDHKRVRVNAPGKGTVVAVDGKRVDRFRATGKNGLLWGAKGEGGGAWVAGAKKGEGLTLGLRDKETGEWKRFHRDPGGGWGELEVSE